jgi:hypothetical protein
MDKTCNQFTSLLLVLFVLKFLRCIVGAQELR